MLISSLRGERAQRTTTTTEVYKKKIKRIEEFITTTD